MNIRTKLEKHISIMKAFKKLIIFGEYSTALEIRDVVNSDYPDDFQDVVNLHFDAKTNLSALSQELNLFGYIISFSNNDMRTQCEGIMNQIEKAHAVSIISKHANVSPLAKIGEGSYIAPLTFIGPNTVIAKHNIILPHSSIGHDSVLGKHCIVNPGAKISGNVIIGSNCLIGSNSVIHQKTNIGSNNIIDAMTYIRKDLKDNMIALSRSRAFIKKR